MHIEKMNKKQILDYLCEQYTGDIKAMKKYLDTWALKPPLTKEDKLLLKDATDILKSNNKTYTKREMEKEITDFKESLK